MPDSFWTVCTEAILAHRRNIPAEAARLLKVAESMLNYGKLNEEFQSKRLNHVNSLRAHFQRSDQIWGISSPRPAPNVDEKLFYPRPLNTVLRSKLGISKEHVVIVELKNTLAANKSDMGTIYSVVESLNQQGCPATLLRTETAAESHKLNVIKNDHIKDAGVVTHSDLPDILASADVLVCAGDVGTVDETARISRMLEYFAMGRPVVMAGGKHGLPVVHLRDAYVMDSFDVVAIANAIMQIKAKNDLADGLANGAIDFYLRYAAEHCHHRAEHGPDRVTTDPKKAALTAQPAQVNGTAGNKLGAGGNSTTTVSVGDAVQKLNNRIQKLEQEKVDLSERLRSMPTIDPLCINAPTFTFPAQKKEDFGIIVFGHTRLDTIGAVLESLNKQDALKFTEVWLDGYQGNHNLRLKVDKTYELAKKYPVKLIHRQAGNFGYTKMLILGLVEMCKKYKDILILEDDCFPTRDAISEFRKELDLIRENSRIFSVYGHHFLVESERETCARFQGWGWATTSEKLMPMLRQLIDCYSMTEERYLEFVHLTFTPDVKARIDITPPRQPSYCLENFFAWDETLCLLTALNNQSHRPTSKRTIYNCGMGGDSTHFIDIQKFRDPPFNLITPEEVWQHF